MAHVQRPTSGLRTILLAIAHLLLSSHRVDGNITPDFRPPCVPLNVVSPYQSVWSCANRLFDNWPQHWDGSVIGMLGLLKVDGVVYRYMGAAQSTEHHVTQEDVIVMPTTTTYRFVAGGVRLVLSFVSPTVALDTDITAASRPLTYCTFEVSSHDGKEHGVMLYYDNTAEGAVKDISETVTWSRLSSKSLAIMQIGTTAQKLVGQGKDRINWGHWLVATPKADTNVHTVMADANTCRSSFINGSFFAMSDKPGPRAAQDGWPVLSVAWDLGTIGLAGRVQRHFTLAYDQVISIRYFGTNMPPLWRIAWPDSVALLEHANAACGKDIQAATNFDKELIANLSKVGGDKFATLGSLVYRQVLGGTQAVWNPVAKEPWVFMKEISSDGDVSTVDVIYPALPMFQYLYPEYFRKILLPLLVYANNQTSVYGVNMPYNLPWAPHHLGHWPICDLSPSRQEQMPVEESGNLLIIMAALYQAQQSITYLKPYWEILDQWADYIVSSLPDPANQLCTDDFEGPSPHNTNLAAKGIVALGAYAKLLRVKGDANKAHHYHVKAQEFVRNWTQAASDGDHFRMQFNLPDSWSLKYNFLYDRALNLSMFPASAAEEEISFYDGKIDRCGVALDGRHTYAKSDWSLWTAAFGSKSFFDKVVAATYNFANSTADRVPFTDWYDTVQCTHKGFRARPVQGGIYARMLMKATPADATPVFI